jgi:hypothetical protein
MRLIEYFMSKEERVIAFRRNRRMQEDSILSLCKWRLMEAETGEGMKGKGHGKGADWSENVKSVQWKNTSD